MNTSADAFVEAGAGLTRRTAFQGYAIAFGATLAAFLVRLALDPLAQDKYPFFTTIIALTLVAWHGGFRPSLLTGVLGFALADWAFVPPRQSFTFTDSAHFGSTLTYFFVSSTIILFGRSMHLARDRAVRNAREAIANQKKLEQEVAQRKQAEEEIRRLNSELERRVELRTAELRSANKELEAFTYSVSHDLRAPLRHVHGYAQILEEECGGQLTPQGRDYTARIRRGSQNLGHLVDDLLNLSRVGQKSLNCQQVPLNLLLDEVLADLKPEVNGRQIEWCVGSLPTVQCDAGLVKVVFTNLLSNAAKYCRPRDRARIEVGQTVIAGQPVLFVRDNGVGFDMKYADKLFGVFQRLHRAEDFEGTGVGLATVLRVVNKHGGKIWAFAEPDKGATFFFTLAEPSSRS